MLIHKSDADLIVELNISWQCVCTHIINVDLIVVLDKCRFIRFMRKAKLFKFCCPRIMWVNSIHPFSFIWLKPNSATIIELTHEDKQPHTLTSIPTVNLGSQISPQKALLLELNPNIRKKASVLFNRFL